MEISLEKLYVDVGLKGLIVSPGLGIPQSMIKLVCTLYHW